jgi:nicotinate-nucleotide adenylyltransferase
VRRLGIFGGTFDPIHFGHLLPALEVLRVFALDTVVFVPAAAPPHKLKEPVTSFAHRFAMLALATAPYESFVLSDLESTRSGPSFTVDTLREVRAGWGAEQLFFIMGSDSLAQITTWYRWPELVELAHLVVLRREPHWGAELERHVPDLLRPRLRLVVPPWPADLAVSGVGGSVFLLENEPYPISATVIRRRLQAGEETDDVLPPQVSRYALKNRVYHRGERDD